MIPIHQTIFDPPHWNCLQACVASVLELQLEVVPNFADSEDMWAALDEFLKPLDLWAVIVPADDPDEAFQFVPRGFHLMVGVSLGGDWGHVVVGQNGIGVHDPTPSEESGGLSELSFYVIFARRFENV